MKKNIRTIINLIISFAYLIMFVGKSFGGDNMIYALGEIHMNNPTLFNNNVYMGNGVVSPRYINEWFFNILMKICSNNWGGAALVWIYLGALVFAVAIVNISIRINEQYQHFVAIILITCIAFCNNYLAGFNLIAIDSIGQGFAISFSILAISFLLGDKPNFNLAWFFAAWATVCHIHDGLYVCAVVFVFGLADTVVEKKFAIKKHICCILAIIVVLLVCLPSVLTDRMELSNDEFVYIYSLLRHPHHLVPSSWNIDLIYKTIWVDIFLLVVPLVINKKQDAEQNKRIIQTVFLILVWISSISLMYAFTELKPIAFISTLMLSKMFRYVLLIGIIRAIETAFVLRENENYISQYVVLIYILTLSKYELAQIGILTAILLLCIIVERHYISEDIILLIKNKRKYIDGGFILYMICVLREQLGMDIGVMLNYIFNFKESLKQSLSAGFSKGVFIVTAVLAISLIQNKKTYLFKNVVVSILLVTLLFMGLAGRVIIYDECVCFISGEEALKYTMGNELYDLAMDFNSKTDKNEDFLADPDDGINTGWFQVVSKRNCYVVEKVIPSSKVTVDDWYNRYMETINWTERSADDIKRIMTNNNIKYVLLVSDCYNKLDERNDFSIALESSEGAFRIYKMN